MARKSRLSRRYAAYAQKKSAYRPILLAMCCGYFVSKKLQPFLLPWGTAVSFSEKPDYKSIDFSNNELKQGLKKIYPDDPSIMKGPETVVFDSKENLYVMTEDANLVQLKDFSHGNAADPSVINATAVFIKDLGMGRPLGGRFASDGTLYIADTLLGLTRVKNVHDPTSKVELVVSSIEGSPIRYADDVIIGPKTGKVYFTDASSISPDRMLESNTWDTLYASKVDLLRGRQTGRVIEYNPKTDQSRVLLDGASFANGIGIDPDEKFLMIGETFSLKVTRYDLQTGQQSVAVGASELPGYPDGVDCSKTHCYAVLPSAVVPAHKLVLAVPDWLSKALRNLMMAVPKWMAPPVKKFGAVVQYNVQTKESKLLLDPTGETIAMLTGVTVHKNKLYLGSLKNDFVGVYELSDK